MRSANIVRLSRCGSSGFHLPPHELGASAILKRLLLVGVDHGDAEGFRRISTLLGSLQPDLILIELSPYGRSFRAAKQRELLKMLSANVSKASRDLRLARRDGLRHPAVVRIRRQICLPFEYRAARRFARAHGSKLVLCDASELSRHWLASWPEMISVQNIRLLLSSPGIPREHELSTFLARKVLTGDQEAGELWTRTVESRWDLWWDRREHYLARRIWTALHALSPTCAVYLGGWQHLMRGWSRPTLRSLLNMPGSHCRFLPDTQALGKPLPEQHSMQSR